MSESSTFSCESCGKSYAWKPELAGKKAKCKCGAMITVPQRPPADESDALYDLVEDDPPARTQPVRPIAAAGAARASAAAQGASGQRCPSCGAGMQPGSVLCLQCGFNLKTGAKMGTAVGGAAAPPPIARPAPGAAGTIAGIPPRPGPIQTQRQADDGGQKKMLILGLVAVLVIGGLVGAFALLKQGGGDEAAVSNKYEDAAIIKKLKEDAHTEGRAFLENKMFSLMGMTTSQANAFVDRLYNMGAKQVLAFDGRVSVSVVVELPDDPAQRKQIIDHYNRYHEGNLDVRPATDEGQRYLRYRLKIANI